MSTPAADSKACQSGPGFTAILKMDGVTFRSVLTFQSEPDAEDYGRTYARNPAYRTEFIGTEEVAA